MGAIDQNWRKSSYSGNGAECVEVATRYPGTIAVRDSKDPHGPVLVTTTDGWAGLTARLQATA
jgi:hypothetical protein